MTPLGTALRRIGDVLSRAAVPFALVGGLAVSARTEPRFTRDIGIAVAVADDTAAEALVHQLVAEGWRTRAVVEQEAVGRLATVRLDAPEDLGTAAVVDLLFASSGIEQELAHHAETLEVLPAVHVPVARRAGLIVLKMLAAAPSRPQDEVDLAALIAAATPGDIEDARYLAGLVTTRGFHRDRDLLGELERRVT